jgi:cytochrome P450
MKPSWSIKDNLNPPNTKNNIHWIITKTIDLIDMLYSYTITFAFYIISIFPMYIKQTDFYKYLNITHNKPNLFSGDFNDLANKGILRFILDKTNSTIVNQQYVKFNLCTQNVFIPLDMDITKQILKSRYVKRGNAYKRLTQFFGYGIFTSWIHDRWKRQKHMGLVLLHGSSLKFISQNIYETTIKDISLFYSHANGSPVDLVIILSRIGLYAFCDRVLGVNVRDIGDELAPKINSVLTYINGSLEPFDIPFTAKYNTFKKDVKFVHNWMLKVINRIKYNIKYNGSSTNAFIDELFKLEINEQVELMISMVLGGHETTARVILGGMYEMMLNPTHIKLVRNEIDDFILNNTTVDYGAIYSSGKFQFSHLLLRETLRLYPPVWLLSRSPTENIFVGTDNSILIKKDTMILLSPLIIQRQKKYWGEDAEVFRPDRFDQDNLPDFLPFIIGVEKCPAERFAIMESIMIITAIFKHYDVKIAEENYAPRPMSAGTFRIFDTLPVIITPRVINSE